MGVAVPAAFGMGLADRGAHRLDDEDFAAVERDDGGGPSDHRPAVNRQHLTGDVRRRRRRRGRQTSARSPRARPSARAGFAPASLRPAFRCVRMFSVMAVAASGATALTVIDCRASSRASDFVRPMMPAFAAAVVGLPDGPGEARGGSHVDDAAGAVVRQVRQRGLAAR